MNGKRWSKGYIEPFWEIEEIKKFQFIKQPLTQEELDNWKSKGYYEEHVKSFSGSMYDNRNPMPTWINNFDEIFPDLHDLTFNFYKMETMEVMPEHTDHYQTYTRIYNAEFKDVSRVLVMLDDWKPGHYLEVDGVGFVNWKAGDYIRWENDVKHSAANIGIEDRYTLQITGRAAKFEDVYTKIHWYNIPDHPSKKSSLTSPEMAYMKKRMQKSNPYIIYMYNQSISELEELVYSEKVIKHINTEGLDIYLYEPLCSYYVDDPESYFPNAGKHSLIFYSEFDESAIDRKQDLRSCELDSIKTFIEKNNLTNVSVYTCDYRVKEMYTYYESTMKLDTYDLFIEHFDINEFEKLDDEQDTSNFSKRFISLNWRYSPHRQLVASYLANLHETTYLTWYFKSSLYSISKEPWYNILSWSTEKPELFTKVINGFNKLNEKSPWNVDLNIKKSTDINHLYFKQMYPNDVIFDQKTEKFGDNLDRLQSTYSDVFCDIVNETRFAQPTANFSEKVYRPIFYRKPFILVAPPKSLYYLRSNGFRTFGDFWDEGYDDIENHVDRLIAIFKIIEDLNAMSISDLQSMYRKMQDIVVHNRRVLLGKCPLRD